MFRMHNRFPFFLLSLIAGTFLIQCQAGSLIAADEKKDKPAKKQIQLMMMDADGSNLKLLFKSDKYTGFGSPAFSPDGKQIAIDAWETHNGQTFVNAHIVIINADGTDPQDIGDGLMPSWSGDGKRFTFCRQQPNFGAWMMDVDGKNREMLDPRGWGSQWSPDGKLISYNEGDNIKIFDAEEETFRYIFPFSKSPYSSYHWNSCWSPDSKSICVLGRSKKDRGYEIATIEIDNGVKGVKVHYRAPKLRPVSDFSWNAKNNLVLCAFKEPAKHKQTQIYTFNPLKQDAPKIFPGQEKFEKYAGSVCWSPDGKKVIFTFH